MTPKWAPSQQSSTTDVDPQPLRSFLSDYKQLGLLVRLDDYHPKILQPVGV